MPQPESARSSAPQNARPARSTSRARPVGWLIAGALALAAAGWYFTRPPPPPPDWVLEPATVESLTLLVTATGTLKPLNQVTVGAEVSGRLDAILVDYNDPVQKGQIIARINTEELEARAVQARAGVTQAAANLAKAELDLGRATDLRARGFGSEEANDQARVVRDVARATLASARAARQQAEVYLEKAVIRSPIDGIVLDRKVEPGQTVAAAFQTPELFVIASDLAQLELTVDIDEADIGDVRVDQPATFTVYTYPNRTFSGRVRELRNAAKTIEKVVTYQGVLEADNADGLLRPGMTATADIAVRTARDVVTVANRALRFLPPESTGFAVDDLEALPPGSGRLWQVAADGRTLTPRVVRLGISDGLRTEIDSGTVRAGDTFVADIDQPRREGVSISIGSD
jgi:HlyD family secretion protein